MMWEGPTIGNPAALYILTMISSTLAIVGAIYGFINWLRKFFLKRFEEVDNRFKKSDDRFKKMDERFEMIEHRIFELALGKSLKQVLMEEKEDKKGEK